MTGWAVLAAALLVVSCGPPPTPSGPDWVANRVPRQVLPDGSVIRAGAWTDDDWFATVDLTRIGGTSQTAELVIHPRSGAGGSVLGAPQRLPLPSGGALGPIGEHVIGVTSSTGFTFFRETAGTWAAAGTLALTEGDQTVAMTDEWLAVRRPPPPGQTGDGEVRMYALDTTGPTVTATLAATLGPEPAWPAALRAGFGRTVSLDGDLLAISGNGYEHPAPGGLRVFRAAGGTWSATQSFGGAPDTPPSFATVHAVDDGPTVDRLVIGPSWSAPDDGGVAVLADTGGGFVPEQTIERDATLPDVKGGMMWGSALAIDGGRLAITSRSVMVPSADPSHADVEVGHVEIHELGTTWSRQAELDVFTSPFDAGVRSTFPYTLSLVGTHLAVSAVLNLDTPPGCPFPCFETLAFEAWSFDRA